MVATETALGLDAPLSEGLAHLELREVLMEAEESADVPKLPASNVLAAAAKVALGPRMLLAAAA